jgi:hypothetical protein
MRNKPERVAWTVLLLSFALFCALVISLPLAIRWFLFNATLRFPTNVTAVRGTVLTAINNDAPPVPIIGGLTEEVNEGVMIWTDETSQAILTFFNRSALTLYSDTSVTLQRTRQPRFRLSPNPDRIVVTVNRGRVRANPTNDGEPLHFEVAFPQGRTELSTGSFSLEVNDQTTQIAARLGKALVIGGRQGLMLPEGKRLLVSGEGVMSPPLPLELNLLATSGLRNPIGSFWEPYMFIQSNVVTPTVRLADLESRSVLDFRSEGADGFHSEVGLIHQVNKDVRDFQSLRVQAEILLLEQSLPGGGLLSSEFPVMIHLGYKDANGSDRDWYHGFYYQPPPANYLLLNQADNSNERVARFLWYPYESENLLKALAGAEPVFIKFIRIYGSGWLYHSMVTNVELLAQE